MPMKLNHKAELVGQFCHSIFELRYKLRKMFQLKLKAAGLQISFEMLEIMRVLLKKDGVNQQELADVLFKDKSNMTYLLDNMVKAGFAVRKEDEADRRNKLIYLTPQAHALQQQLAPIATACFLALADQVTDVEVKAGLHMLSLMNSSFDFDDL